MVGLPFSPTTAVLLNVLMAFTEIQPTTPATKTVLLLMDALLIQPQIYVLMFALPTPILTLMGICIQEDVWKIAQLIRIQSQILIPVYVRQDAL